MSSLDTHALCWFCHALAHIILELFLQYIMIIVVVAWATIVILTNHASAERCKTSLKLIDNSATCNS